MAEPVADATMRPSVSESASGSASTDGSGNVSTDASADGSASSVADSAASAAAGAGEGDSPEPKGSLWSRLPGILVRVVSWTVLIVCGLLIVGFVLVPRLTGSTPYTVLTGSMRPSMPPGTTVVVKPIDFAQIAVGDVITYQISSGEPDVVTHRVIGVNVTPEGVRLETQGDANPVPDQELVREEQVRGKVWYWLPVIGYVTNGVTSDTRTWLAQGLGVALIGYAVVTLVVTVVRRKKKGPDGDDAGDDAGNDASEPDAVPVARVEPPVGDEQSADDLRLMSDAATMNDSLTTDNVRAEELVPATIAERPEPSEPSDLTEPFVPTEASEVTDPTEPFVPTEASEVTDPSELAVPSEPSEKAVAASAEPSNTMNELPTRRSLRRDRAARADSMDGKPS